MKTENYCQVGTPVQLFFSNYHDGKYSVCPAIISNVVQSKVDIRFYMNDSQGGIVEYNVRHADFKKDGEHYWDYIPQRHP